jgi:8-oxo-dGTP diphosphatase
MSPSSGSSGSPTPRGVVAVASRHGRYLAIRRGPTVAAGGRICFPGGHVEPGEAEHDAVERECREEVGAAVVATTRVWSSVTNWGTALSWWAVRLVDERDLVPHPVEVAEILWLSADEMLALPDLLPGNREFLVALREGAIRLEP